MGSGGWKGVSEGEGVVGTYSIQPENNDVIIVAVDLHHMDATLWTCTQPNACWKLVHVVMGACHC